MIPSNFQQTLAEFKATPEDQNPKLCYWPEKNRYFVSVHFSRHYIESKGMQIIYG